MGDKYADLLSVLRAFALDEVAAAAKDNLQIFKKLIFSFTGNSSTR